MSLADLTAGIMGGFAGALGRKNAPVPEPVTPIVAEQEDPDLQELTPQVLAEIELAESMWPQKELAAILRERYATGEGDDAALAVSEAQSGREFWGKKQERRADTLRLRKASDARVVQAHETPAVQRTAEIIAKIAALKQPKP